jgi:hypothetical protein
MKSHKEILDKLGIKDKTKHHNWDYVYESFLSAMESAAKQALGRGFKNGLYAEIGDEDELTFENYLKEISND